MNIVKQLIFLAFIGAILVLIPGAPFLVSSAETNQSETSTTLEIEQATLTRHEQRVRNAAVKVVLMDGMGHGSGTYTIIDGCHVILTAAHVVEDQEEMRVLGTMGESVVGKVIYRDANYDFAVLLVPEMSTRTPMRFNPTRKTMSSLVGDDVTYTGFPSGHGLMTIRGEVAGVDGRRALLIHSYAWMGASGSGVYDLNGRLIGILVAVDVGRFYHPQIVEDIVWIVPITEIDIEAMRRAISQSLN